MTNLYQGYDVRIYPIVDEDFLILLQCVIELEEAFEKYRLKNIDTLDMIVETEMSYGIEEDHRAIILVATKDI